jgi:hypothetical protein
LFLSRVPTVLDLLADSRATLYAKPILVGNRKAIR